jgi:hypothetical protein
MLRHRTQHMVVRPSTLLRAVLVVAVVWSLAGAAGAYAKAPEPRVVPIMTQNVYQGTEFRHLQALAGHNPTLEEALAATTADYGTYVATRFKDRSKLIAAEIAKEGPWLVGLQEIATWHAGAFEPAHPFALPPAVSEDFTQELLTALTEDGAHYEVVSRRDNNFTLAFPILTLEGLKAVGMVESGVILARTDLPASSLTVLNPKSGTYRAHIPLIANPLDPDPPHGFTFTNSWQSIDVHSKGKAFRFITTHLDALAPGGLVSGAQALQLLEEPAHTKMPLILAGDMNSGPVLDPAAYNAFIAGGLSDTWVAGGLGSPPLTCCHLAPNDLVSDPTAVYTEDPDHVFTHGPFTVLNEHLVGNVPPFPEPEPFIWPSDHAGMVARLKLG